MKKTIINPEFINEMHKNTTGDDHGTVILKIKLTRTKKSYQEEILEMRSFAEGLYEFMNHFGVET